MMDVTIPNQGRSGTLGPAVAVAFDPGWTSFKGPTECSNSGIMGGGGGMSSPERVVEDS